MKRRSVTQPLRKVHTRALCAHCAFHFKLHTGRRWRRSDAIGGCRLRYSCCISAENHLLFSLNSPPFIVCIGVQRQPDFFSIDQRLICAPNTEIRCTGLKSLRGLKGFRGPAWPKTASRQKHDHRCRPRANEKNCLNEKKTTAIDTHYTRTLFWNWNFQSVCVLVSDSNCHH